MKALTPYLFFNGNCEQALQFYADCFGGKIVNLMRMGDGPVPVPESQKNRVMHGVLQAGDLTVMASDGRDDETIAPGDNLQLAIDFSSADEQSRVFEKLSAGGEVTMALADTFWGARFGTCKDRFGIQWMFNFDKGTAVA